MGEKKIQQFRSTKSKSTIKEINKSTGRVTGKEIMSIYEIDIIDANYEDLERLVVGLNSSNI